ncbi:hypothetical protein K4F52_009250 [Lecanicillium sp. MT-2017a]|nr:hypothetical protein K4F52_009250 [Lecanicillium sp. MT-2017a]
MDINKWQNYVELLRGNPPDKESLAFFSGLPSTSSFINDHAYLRPVPFGSRFVKKDSMDTLWSQTLNTPDTIKHAVVLIRKDIMSLQYRIKDEEVADYGCKWVPDVALLVQLGSKINGFHNTVHGGVLAAVLDECFATAVETVRCCLSGPKGKYLTTINPLYTANLSLNYRRPAESPGVLIVEARLQQRQGRKWLLQGRIRGEDGRVLVDATSLWIAGTGKI